MCALLALACASSANAAATCLVGCEGVDVSLEEPSLACGGAGVPGGWATITDKQVQDEVVALSVDEWAAVAGNSTSGLEPCDDYKTRLINGCQQVVAG